MCQDFNNCFLGNHLSNVHDYYTTELQKYNPLELVL